MKHLNLTATPMLALLIAGCSDQGDDDVFTWEKEVSYAASMTQFLPDTANYLWAEGTFLRVIWDKVMAGELAALSPADEHILSKEDLERMLVRVDTFHTVHPETMADTTVIVRSEFDPTSITDVAFKERLSYNAATNTIDKNVLAVAPVREVIDQSTSRHVGQALLFWVNVNQDEEDD